MPATAAGRARPRAGVRAYALAAFGSLRRFFSGLGLRGRRGEAVPPLPPPVALTSSAGGSSPERGAVEGAFLAAACATMPVRGADGGATTIPNDGRYGRLPVFHIFPICNTLGLTMA